MYQKEAIIAVDYTPASRVLFRIPEYYSNPDTPHSVIQLAAWPKVTSQSQNLSCLQPLTLEMSDLVGYTDCTTLLLST